MTVNHPMTQTRGSALILVVLLTLILAATSIVALRDVARATRGSAVYRTRAQAQLTSDGATRTYSDWLGTHAPTVLEGMRQGLKGKMNDGSNDFTGVFAGRHEGAIDLDGNGTFSKRERERSLAIRGPVLTYTDDELGKPCGAGCTPMLVNSGEAASDDETGLFRIVNGEKTFESRRKSQFRVVARDIVNGPPAPWYDQDTCLKKALIAADARVGQVDPNWERSNNVASARHGIEAFIGPVQFSCN